MAGPYGRRRHTLGERHRENIIMSAAARTVRFSDEPQIFTPGAAGKQGLSRRQRRNKADAQRKAEAATVREEEFTLQELAAEVKRFASGDSNGVVTDSADDSFSPACFCSDCVDIIAAYFENENLAKHVLGMEDSSPVYMKDVKKLAASFLDSQKLRFYDQVTVEAFNDRAMAKGGAGCATPLSMASLANDGRFEKIAGKEMVCAILSTGVILLCENGFKSHEQLLKENVDSNTIRSDCSCLKSDKWLTRRAAAERKMQTEKVTKDNDWGDESHEEEEEENEEEEEADREREEFRPGNIANIASSCLGLCRHDSSCVVNSTNKARVLHSLMLIPVPENEKGGIASTTPGQYYSVVTHPNDSLIFSLGATVYEAFGYHYDDLYWNTWREEKGTPAAKVYTTVQTVAAPFFGNVLTPHVDHQNPYGHYRTFRICLPGFSGRYNDPSIGWRSELYFNLTFHAAKLGGRGGRKLHRPFFEGDEFVAWPRQKQIKVEGGVFHDESGDLAGNYLGEKIGGALEGTSAAVTAYNSVKNLSVTLKFINECIAELLKGPFKQRLVQLKMFNTPHTTHETQRLKDEVRYFARIIERWERSGEMFYQDIESSKKYISAHVQDFTVAAAALS